MIEYDAVEEIPRAFWRGFDVKIFRGLIATKRLTLPERTTLWDMLGFAGLPPRVITFTVPTAWEGASDEELQRTLDWLQSNRRVHAV